MQPNRPQARDARRLPGVRRRYKRTHAWWRAALHSDGLQVAGQGLHGQPLRFRYAVYDHLTARMDYASESSCIAYARALVARRRLARAIGVVSLKMRTVSV